MSSASLTLQSRHNYARYPYPIGGACGRGVNYETMESKMRDCENYYCLATDGLLYALGNHGDYEAADDTARSLGLDVVWLFGEDSRDSWRDSLNNFKKNRL